MKEALIIFIRNLVPGKVKTRLANEIGNEAALEVYKKLLHHTQFISSQLNCHKFVYYSDMIIEYDIWDNKDYFKRVQRGDDLGQRMQNAFKEIFEMGYTKPVIIGSDCLELSSSGIEKAFHMLEKYDAVLGPASDGGYYLLGLKQVLPNLFENKNWSTSSVLTDSITDLRKSHSSYFLLPVLRDIDKIEDLLAHG